MENKEREAAQGKEPLSKIRKHYIVRLVGRSIIFVLCVLMCVLRPQELEILGGWNFFGRFSVMHLLWGIWVVDMIGQLVPVGKKIALGSQKLFLQRFRPIRERINHAALRSYITATTKAAYKVFLIWSALAVVLWVLKKGGYIDNTVLFMLSVCFYVCDLICVLIWCPFRLIVKNRCCTTCRIFNWDHLMMFTPMVFVGGFYALSLFVLSLAVWTVWEICVLLYPERFWEHSNAALQCANCTDKLCTQYCRKLRR